VSTGPRAANPLAPLLVVAAATLWGTVGAAQELGAPAAPPVAVAALRSLAGGVLLAAILVASGRGRAMAASIRAARGPLAAAAMAITIFQVGYFGGIRLNGVAVGTLLAIGSAPVWAGGLEAAVGRRPDRRWAVATAVTVTGTALLVLPRGAVDASAWGVGASLMAGLAYASYTVASKRALERGADGTSAMAWTFVGSGILFAPSLLVLELSWVRTPSGAVAVVWLGVAATALAYTLFAAGLRHVDAPTATTLTLAEPLTATVVAVAVLGERLGVAGSTGAALVTIGLGLAGRRRRRAAAPTVARPADARPDARSRAED
jgi:drug/metabolite transporter, DME family